MRFGFVTCVQLGLDCMEEIYSCGGRLDLAVTLRDDLATDKSGRIYVDEFCKEHGIEVFKLKSINAEAAISRLRDARLDWLFIIGWSQIAKPRVLETARHGVLGIHPTLLPQGRGRAAIPWAIIKGLDRTGVTMFKLDQGVDTGPIAGQVELAIPPDETATTLYDRVCAAHRTLIRSVWPQLVSGKVVMREQDESLASEWPGRRPEDGEIFPSMSVSEAERLVRAVTHPYPGAFWREPDRVVRVWSARAVQDRPGLRRDEVLLHLSDGLLEAVEFDIESHATR